MGLIENKQNLGAISAWVLIRMCRMYKKVGGIGRDKSLIRFSKEILRLINICMYNGCIDGE